MVDSVAFSTLVSNSGPSSASIGEVVCFFLVDMIDLMFENVMAMSTRGRQGLKERALYWYKYVCVCVVLPHPLIGERHAAQAFQPF